MTRADDSPGFGNRECCKRPKLSPHIVVTYFGRDGENGPKQPLSSTNLYLQHFRDLPFPTSPIESLGGCFLDAVRYLLGRQASFLACATCEMQGQNIVTVTGNLLVRHSRVECSPEWKSSRELSSVSSSQSTRRVVDSAVPAMSLCRNFRVFLGPRLSATCPPPSVPLSRPLICLSL